MIFFTRLPISTSVFLGVAVESLLVGEDMGVTSTSLSLRSSIFLKSVNFTTRQYCSCVSNKVRRLRYAWKVVQMAQRNFFCFPSPKMRAKSTDKRRGNA